MRLKQLIKDISNISVKGSKDIEISGITSNSKMVSPGNLFVAKRGQVSDGNQYIPEAIKAGATCVLTDIYDPSLQLVQIISPDVIGTEATLARNYYQSASEDLFMVGVTGTSGKTTTSYAIKHILECAKMRSGLVGTIEYVMGDVRYPATRTTPDVVANHKMLREMVRAGMDACVMEVTSHALEQRRAQHIEFDVACFTNLTHEHLDYHVSMESYCKAKQKLFLDLKNGTEKVAIFNSDCPWSERMKEGCRAKIITYGIEKKADITASDISFNAKGTTFEVHYENQRARFSWPLIGRFNVSNALCVIAVGLTRGLTLEELSGYMHTFQTAPGRLERVENSLKLNLYVDYAHKADALRNVLITLRECMKGHGKLITVFGCGGDRDKEKRPMMACAAEELSDVVIVTSDNPRSEDPQLIAKEICSGFTSPERHLIELDRKKAIELAVDLATPDDIIVIAGKGHEVKQYFNNYTIDFDDRLIAKEYCLIKSSQESLV